MRREVRGESGGRALAPKRSRKPSKNRAKHAKGVEAIEARRVRAQGCQLRLVPPA